MYKIIFIGSKILFHSYIMNHLMPINAILCYVDKNFLINKIIYPLMLKLNFIIIVFH